MSYVPPLASDPIFLNVPEWLAENEKFFLPPVCNKMMHNTQLKVGSRIFGEFGFPIFKKFS